MGVSKNRGKTPKMDGENNGSKPYEQMDKWMIWGYHNFWKHQGKPWNYNLILVFIMETPIKLHGIVMEKPLFLLQHPYHKKKRQAFLEIPSRL